VRVEAGTKKERPSRNSPPGGDKEGPGYFRGGKPVSFWVLTCRRRKEMGEASFESIGMKGKAKTR